MIIDSKSDRKIAYELSFNLIRYLVFVLLINSFLINKYGHENKTYNASLICNKNLIYLAIDRYFLD